MILNPPIIYVYSYMWNIHTHSTDCMTWVLYPAALWHQIKKNGNVPKIQGHLRKCSNSRSFVGMGCVLSESLSEVCRKGQVAAIPALAVHFKRYFDVYSNITRLSHHESLCTYAYSHWGML